MKKFTVKINGQEYPCYFTLGAGLIFQQETGRDVSEIKDNDVVDSGVLIYAQCKAAALREGLDFPFTLMDFLVQITDEDLAAIKRALDKEQTAKSKKK